MWTEDYLSCVSVPLAVPGVEWMLGSWMAVVAAGGGKGKKKMREFLFVKFEFLAWALIEFAGFDEAELRRQVRAQAGAWARGKNNASLDVTRRWLSAWRRIWIGDDREVVPTSGTKGVRCLG